MDERWELESTDNELKFFFDRKLIIHLYKFNNIWHTSVLGHDKMYQDRNLSDAIKNAEAAAIECGWM
jgi:hypothetical protein